MTTGNSPTLRQILMATASFTQRVGNLAGAAGATGPAGPAGPAGPTGPQGPAGSGNVTSVFSRTGVVVAVAGDYTATQVTNTPAGGITTATVQAALNELDTKKVIAPGANTADFVPQWNGANSKTLKDGLGVGTGPNQLVQLDGSSKLPAVDGSQLTGLTASSLLPGYIFGLGLANNAGTPASKIDIALGQAMDGGNVVLMNLAAGITKDLAVAWAVGTNQGMLATGAAVANGTYHIFLIRRTDTGVVDIAADTSVTGANITANTAAAYTQFRRIGSIVRSAGSILAFTQNGNEFLWAVPVADVAAGTASSTVGALQTLTVPTGIKVNAKVGLRVDFIAGSVLLLTSPDQTNTVPSGSAYTVVGSTATTPLTVYADFRTNTSAQVRQRSDSASVQFGIVTNGWVDNRGGGVTSNVSALDLTKADVNSLGYHVGMTNGTFVVSASAGVLTIDLKTLAGNNPSPSDPVTFFFRNNTGTTGNYVVRQVTAATTLVAPSSSTFGVASSIAFRIWIVGFDDAGTFRLGAGVFSNATQIFPLRDGMFASSTAIGAGSTSAGVIYTGSAVTTKAMRVLGFAEWSSSGITAGTWATTNLSLVQLFGPGVPLPGTPLQYNHSVTTPNDTASTATFQMTSTSLAITPTSAANKCRIKAYGFIAAGSVNAQAKISRGTTNNTNMIGAFAWDGGTAQSSTLGFEAFDHPNTAASQTYGVQGRAVGGGAWFWGGGVEAFMSVEELMG